MFNKILIANRGDQQACLLTAQPNCMPAHAVRADDLDAETSHV